MVEKKPRRERDSIGQLPTVLDAQPTSKDTPKTMDRDSLLKEGETPQLAGARKVKMCSINRQKAKTAGNKTTSQPQPIILDSMDYMYVVVYMINGDLRSGDIHGVGFTNKSEAVQFARSNENIIAWRKRYPQNHDVVGKVIEVEVSNKADNRKKALASSSLSGIY